MAEFPKFVRHKTDALDAAGNTTAAIGKGFSQPSKHECPSPVPHSPHLYSTGHPSRPSHSQLYSPPSSLSSLKIPICLLIISSSLQFAICPEIFEMKRSFAFASNTFSHSALGALKSSSRISLKKVTALLAKCACVLSRLTWRSLKLIGAMLEM